MTKKLRISAWCIGWLDGFLAAGFLFTGRREKYEEFRDIYLKARGLL